MREEHDMRGPLRTVLLTLAALALIAGACGAEDGEPGGLVTDPDAEAAEPTFEPEPEPTFEPEPEPTVAPEPTATRAPDPTATPEPTATAFPTAAPIPLTTEQLIDSMVLDSSDAWCPRSEALEEQFGRLDLVDPLDAVALETEYVGALEAANEILPFAPFPIGGHVVVSIDGLQVVVDGLDAVDWNVQLFDPSILASIEEEQARAGFVVNRYNFEVCRIDNDFSEDDNPDSVFGPATPDDLARILDEGVMKLVTIGFTQEEARCIIQNIDFSKPGLPDTAELLRALEACAISTDRLAELGG